MPERLRRRRARHAVRALPFALLCAYAAATSAADAKPGYMIQCFEETASRKQYCFAPSKLTIDGATRSSPLYTGVGSDLAMTKLVAVADCRKATVALKDAKGAPAKGQPALKAVVAKALADDMCAVKPPAAGTAAKG